MNKTMNIKTITSSVFLAPAVHNLPTAPQNTTSSSLPSVYYYQDEATDYSEFLDICAKVDDYCLAKNCTPESLGAYLNDQYRAVCVNSSWENMRNAEGCTAALVSGKEKIVARNESYTYWVNDKKRSAATCNKGGRKQGEKTKVAQVKCNKIKEKKKVEIVPQEDSCNNQRVINIDSIVLVSNCNSSKAINTEAVEVVAPVVEVDEEKMEMIKAQEKKEQDEEAALFALIKAKTLEKEEKEQAERLVQQKRDEDEKVKRFAAEKIALEKKRKEDEKKAIELAREKKRKAEEEEQQRKIQEDKERQEREKKREKSAFCKSFLESYRCRHAHCKFAHSCEELNKIPCLNGDNCWDVKCSSKGKYENNGRRICKYFHPEETVESYACRHSIVLPKIVKVAPKVIPKVQVQPMKPSVAPWAKKVVPVVAPIIVQAPVVISIPVQAPIVQAAPIIVQAPVVSTQSPLAPKVIIPVITKTWAEKIQESKVKDQERDERINKATVDALVNEVDSLMIAIGLDENGHLKEVVEEVVEEEDDCEFILEPIQRNVIPQPISTHQPITQPISTHQPITQPISTPQIDEEDQKILALMKDTSKYSDEHALNVKTREFAHQIKTKNTKMCESVKAGKQCKYKGCNFAHSVKDLVKTRCGFSRCFKVHRTSPTEYKNTNRNTESKNTICCYLHENESDRSYSLRLGLPDTPLVSPPLVSPPLVSPPLVPVVPLTLDDERKFDKQAAMRNATKILGLEKVAADSLADYRKRKDEMEVKLRKIEDDKPSPDVRVPHEVFNDMLEIFLVRGIKLFKITCLKKDETVVHLKLPKEIMSEAVVLLVSKGFSDFEVTIV